MLKILYTSGVIWFAVAAWASENASLRVNITQSTVDAITANGYVAESHQVTTEDGYILGVFRIPYARNQASGNESRPVVLMMHGIYGQSNNFLFLGPEYSIGYNLADAGFDVWLGNARGNIHSRAHVTLNPDSAEDMFQFFDFSWEEIGMIDVPTIIDYILNYTKQEKLHFIGHSQGGTVYLVLESMRSEYNEKMATVHLLAGVGYQEYFPDEQLKQTAVLTDFIYAYALGLGLVEVTPEVIDELLPAGATRADMCFRDIKYKDLCELIGVKHFMRETSPTDPNAFGGGSIKQIAHYGQNIRDKLFKRFDYGTLENQEHYGSTTPPLYDLGLITSDVVMHYTVNDNLLDERDVLAMAADMPNTRVRKVARETFEHSDFAGATDAKELVTDYIITVINSFDNGTNPNENENENDEDIDGETEELVVVTPPSEVTGSAIDISLNVIFKMYLLICALYCIV